MSIAVGFGGIIESATGRILTSVQVKGWKDCMLRDWFQGAFGLPTVILNDTVAGGYGEYMRGSGKGTRVFFYTNIGSGIGGCLIIDGTCYDGLGLRGRVLRPHVSPGLDSRRAGARARSRTCARGGRSRGGCAPRGTCPRDPCCSSCAAAGARTLRCPMLGEAARQGDAFALAEIEQDRRLPGHGPVERDHAFQPRMRRDRRRGCEHGRRAARPGSAHGGGEGVHIRRGTATASCSAPSATRRCPSVRSCTLPGAGRERAS